MKKLFLISSVCVAGIAQAEPRPLPPIIDHSSYAQELGYKKQGSGNQATLGLLNQVTSLQADVRQLRGQLELQKHELDNLKKRQQSIYADINDRLQKLTPSNANAAGSTSVLSSGDLAVPIAQRKAASSFVKQAEPANGKTSVTEKMAFNAAYANVRDNHYKQAIMQFKQFLIDYPAGEYSDNAQFWLASVYRVTRDIPAAKKGFKAVAVNYPKSEKASVSLYKLAGIYIDEKNKGEAKKIYQQLIKQYAGSTSAKMAEKKLREMDL